jgi:hypothetical protein
MSCSGITRKLVFFAHNLSFLASVLALCLCAISTHAQNANVTISVDATANRQPINPNIYGVAHATTAQLTDLNSPLNRNGGNNTTRYNWQNGTPTIAAAIWYFESIGDTSVTAGERGDTFIANSRSANAKAMLTVPMIDWVTKVGASFDVPLPPQSVTLLVVAPRAPSAPTNLRIKR